MNRRAKNAPDYYKILGVLEDASVEEITAAFHALARKHHPDTREHHDPDSQQFKTLVEAYEVLADPQRRRTYDRRAARTIQVRLRSTDRGEKPAPAVVRDSEQNAAQSRLDIHAKLPVSPEEARHGGACQIRITRLAVCSQCGGPGTIQDRACETCQGTGREYRVDLANLHVPRQVRAGTLLRIKGLGHEQADLANPETKRSGCLILSVVIRPYW